MKTYYSFIMVVSLVVFGCTAHATVGPTMYGALSNFDVINDTGIDTHGLEIEIDGVSSADVVYTFGDPYQRYGNPQIVGATANNCFDHSNNCVFVRYTSTYNPNANPKWFATTSPASSPVLRTQGHQCWKYGDPAYPNVPCDHFGVSLTKNPSNTIYTWLVEGKDVNNNPNGKLVKFSDPNGKPIPVLIPSPVWNISPNSPPIGVQAVIQPVILPPPPPAPPQNPPPGTVNQWGEPIWVKIYTKELNSEAGLDDLVPGNALALPIPGSDPAEIEWQLLQSPPLGDSGGKLDTEQEITTSGEAVTKVYEYYKYTGGRNSQDGEALCDDPTKSLPVCGPESQDPDFAFVYGVGDLIGAQNAAVNLTPPACAAQIANNSILVKRSGYIYNWSQGLYNQTVTLTNTGGSAIPSPISLALDNLSSNANLFNLSGKTICTAPQQPSQFINVTVSTVTQNAPLAPNTSIKVVLKFANPTKGAINYNTRLLAGPGMK